MPFFAATAAAAGIVNYSFSPQSLEPGSETAVVGPRKAKKIIAVGDYFFSSKFIGRRRGSLRAFTGFQRASQKSIRAPENTGKAHLGA